MGRRGRSPSGQKTVLCYELGVAELPNEMLACRALLRAHCYRMLGHPQDADDAVQDTFVRALRGLDGFEGRASAKTWLVRIATHVCLDALAARRRRRMPTDEANGTPAGPFTPTDPAEWIAPFPDAWLPSVHPAPDEQVELRSRVDLALVTVLQQLPPRQRAALLLADVFDCSATEVADALDWTVAGVNSALQRARAKLDRGGPRRAEVNPELVARYREAFLRYDLDAVVELLTEDATFDMPPIPVWLRGRSDIAAFLRGPGSKCRGSAVLPVRACGALGFAQYRDGGRTPWALVVLETRGERVSAVHSFLDVATLLPLFGLPPTIGPEKNTDEVRPAPPSAPSPPE